MSGGNDLPRHKFPSFLPFLEGHDGWTQEVFQVLSSVASGPDTSEVKSGRDLAALITTLRRYSCLSDGRPGLTRGLSIFFDRLISEYDAADFFKSTLPGMAALALKLPELLLQQADEAEMSRQSVETQSLPLKILPRQCPGIVNLSQETAAALLACSFLCLFPTVGRGHVLPSTVNFDTIFGNIRESEGVMEQKLFCLVNYMRRVTADMPPGVVSFERKVNAHRTGDTPSGPGGNFWRTRTTQLCHFQVKEEGTIEDDSDSCLEVDFANMYLGGGALGHGCVQEEIRFMINPELICGMIFMEAMDDNEAIEIIGSERFSSYQGYASGFRFAGDYVDMTPRDDLERRLTCITAIDALCQVGDSQFTRRLLLRETNKAFIGFLDSRAEKEAHARGEPPLIAIVREEDRQAAAMPNAEPTSEGASNLDGGPHKDTRERAPSDDVQMDVQVAESDSILTGHVSGQPNSRLTERDGDGGEAVGDARLEGGGQLTSDTRRVPNGVATGNWGCGVFGGDLEWKAMLQWCAASQAGHERVLYFPFNDGRAQHLQEVVDWVRSEGWSVGDLFELLEEYGAARLSRRTRTGLFAWILPKLASSSLPIAPAERCSSLRR